jgi:hypothetical protein
VLAAVTLKRGKTPTGTGNPDLCKVGIYVEVKPNPPRSNAAIAAEWKVSFFNNQTGTYNDKLTVNSANQSFTHVFVQYSSDWGSENIGLTWKEFLLCDIPHLLSERLRVRITFNKVQSVLKDGPAEDAASDPRGEISNASMLEELDKVVIGVDLMD